MSQRATEQLHKRAEGLDRQPLTKIALLLSKGQSSAAAAVDAAARQIADASQAMAQSITQNAVLHYVAAGSSGLMAAADAMELGGTFSIPPTQIRIHMAGGLPTGAEMPGDTEDETAQIREAMIGITPLDTVIAVSASGSTPYTSEAARIAKSAGATVIGIANNAGAELLRLSDYPILLATPPELLSGSTRMGAGTSQKIALNMLSTLMAVQLGHVHDGMMVNLTADNAKLLGRARGIVATIADVEDAVAETALSRAGGAVKPAVLIASGITSLSEANALLNASNGHLRPVLETLKNQ
ncbi:N-acetylmuramic acid 6-phosphate etherase [Aliiroseovarius halocynthiae]|uniref:N-acetylmuramic acid 6-phosphate etherase n=1 Tax=Aliiroseovarius halocynthiae TaxID=985055 RepID=A0A545SQM8_9RHOB|nr:N-acetylmuramic acid 6-phosphate etherase [Aliiroseovarius halocynthiae]TQV67176.1 N-acetylmuramic acid 6-phosphate etherase [Aliiroseovarius halocynthiae]SMR82093.1 N-acetylmuramic acid 6-phosphate etherase [Aliiroseovarius halocynthiae]